MANFDTLLILTNSPGEIASWVSSICTLCVRRMPTVSIVVMLTPCQYATGNEHVVVQQFPGVKKVYKPMETLAIMMGFKQVFFRRNFGKILYLGGDPFYAKLLAKRYQWPLFGYTEHVSFDKKGFDYVLTRSLDKDLMATKIALTPLDRATILHKYHLEDHPYGVFFFGSRPKHFKALFPYINEMVASLKADSEAFFPLGLVSPFVSDADLAEMVKQCPAQMPIMRGDSIEILSLADFLITIPGTSTAEAMYLHVPMAVILPLSRPDLIIFDGLLGLITGIPFLGKWLLKGVMAWLKKRPLPVVSLPNRLSKTRIAEEIIGDYTAIELASRLKEFVFLDAKKRDQKAQLERFFTPSCHACEDILDAIFEVKRHG